MSGVTKRDRAEFHRMVWEPLPCPNLEAVRLFERIATLRQALDDIAMGNGTRRLAFEVLRADEEHHG